MYPRIICHKEKLRENAIRLQTHLEKRGITLFAVTKVFGADPNIIRILDDAGVHHFADARLLNLSHIEKIQGERMLLRIPMLSELEDVLRYADLSLQSELKTLRALNELCVERGKQHKVLLMIDLGDLREGIFSNDELKEVASELALMQGVQWVGLGTNLTCYGGVLPTRESLERLIQLRDFLEEDYKVDLPIISAGNSSSLYLVDEDWPKELNQLRVGEALANGTESSFGKNFIGLHEDVFTIEAQIVELKEKPSVPIGTRGKNAFGKEPVFEDYGIQKRAIIALGMQDTDPEDLVPILEGAKILGASSDHMIVDITHVRDALDVGSILAFRTNYRSVLRAYTSAYVYREIE